MGTRFEIVLAGDDPARLRAAGEAALDEIRSAHDRLTVFDRSSVVSRINAAAGERPVRVDSELLGLFVLADRVRAESGGAFDITVARTMERMGFDRGGGHPGSTGERSVLVIDADRSTALLVDRAGAIDMGGIGKGFGLDLAARALGDAGVASALLHGGTSTARAIGPRPDGVPWTVSVPPPEPAGLALRVGLRDGAVSVSMLHGGSRDAPVHVVDPRAGAPAMGCIAAVCAAPSAAEADAWSTAMIVTGEHAPGVWSAVWRGGSWSWRDAGAWRPARVDLGRAG
jgi:thiamine biosynthesis lipoprotein